MAIQCSTVTEGNRLLERSATHRWPSMISSSADVPRLRCQSFDQANNATLLIGAGVLHRVC